MKNAISTVLSVFCTKSSSNSYFAKDQVLPLVLGPTVNPFPSPSRPPCPGDPCHGDPCQSSCSKPLPGFHPEPSTKFVLHHGVGNLSPAVQAWVVEEVAWTPEVSVWCRFTGSSGMSQHWHKAQGWWISDRYQHSWPTDIYLHPSFSLPAISDINAFFSSTSVHLGKKTWESTGKHEISSASFHPFILSSFHPFIPSWAAWRRVGAACERMTSISCDRNFRKGRQKSQENLQQNGFESSPPRKKEKRKTAKSHKALT